MRNESTNKNKGGRSFDIKDSSSKKRTNGSINSRKQGDKKFYNEKTSTET